MLALAEKFDLFRCPCDWKEDDEGIRDEHIKAQHGQRTSQTKEEEARRRKNYCQSRERQCPLGISVTTETLSSNERQPPCRKRPGSRWSNRPHHTQEGATQVQAEADPYIQEQGPQARPEGLW